MFNLARSSVSTLFQPQGNLQPSRIDLLKITQVFSIKSPMKVDLDLDAYIIKVQDVQLDRGQETVVGTLHLTVHHLIFSYSEEELWVKKKEKKSKRNFDKCMILNAPF
jgi:hypothetical protein